MPLLIAPDVSYHSSWLEGAAEFDGTRQDGGGSDGWPLAELKDARTFRRFVDSLVNDALPESPRQPGHVPCTYLWIVEGGTFLGSLAIRHELNDFLLNAGRAHRLQRQALRAAPRPRIAPWPMPCR